MGVSAYLVQLSLLLLPYVSYRSFYRFTHASVLPMVSSTRTVTGQHPLQDDNSVSAVHKEVFKLIPSCDNCKSRQAEVRFIRRPV